MNKKDVPFNEGGKLHQIFYRYIPYWPLFIFLTAIFCLLAWQYTRMQIPLYEATASILIKDEEESASESKILESLDMLSSKKNVQNEIEVIRSKSLMLEVVTKLHLYTSVYKEENGKAFLMYSLFPIRISAAYPEKLEAKEKVHFSLDDKNGFIQLDNKKYPMAKWVKTPYGTLKFENNEVSGAIREGSLFFSLIHPSMVANQLRANLNVAPMMKTSIVVLKMKDPIAKRAEDVLNTLAETYQKVSLNEKNLLAENTLSFVEDRIKYVEDDLDSLEKEIQQFKSREGIVDLGLQGNMYLQNLSLNDQKSTGISVQLAALEQVEHYVKSKQNAGGVVPSSIEINDPMLTDLLQKLYNSELEYERLEKTTGENNPALLALKSQIDKVRPSLLENITNQKKVLKASLDKIKANNNTYTSRLTTLPRKEKALLDLNRQQAIKSNVYTFLLQKREETALSHSATVANNRLVDMAESYMLPPSPSRPVVYFLAFISGILMTRGIISAKELLNTKILFRSEIECFTNIPIVAELSSVEPGETIMVSQVQHSIVTEQFRHLRTAIGLYGKKKNKGRLLVTSSIAGEGKSFVSSNLALSLALSGKKVVLIDLDLRNPKTSESFMLTNAKGIVDFLRGDKEPSEIIAQTDHDQLSVIPAGRGGVNSIELLLSGKMDKLFKYLSDQFDYIIADSSPIDPVADAIVLSDFFDTTLFVIRHGHTPKTLVQLLDESKKVKSLKNLFIVFNGVKRRGILGRGYGYGYGYGYEYVYKDRVYQPKASPN